MRCSCIPRCKHDLLASVGVNPSTTIAQGTPGVVPSPEPVKINFDNVYVNQCGAYDVLRRGYTVLSTGTYEINVNLNLFLLTLGGAEPIELTNLGRYSLIVWKQSPGAEPVQIAGKNGLFNRAASVAEEFVPIPGGRMYAINNSQETSIDFMIATDRRNVHHVSVGDLIYVTLRLVTAPNGNFNTYQFSVTSAGREDNQEISASFFNVKRH